MKTTHYAGFTEVGFETQFEEYWLTDDSLLHCDNGPARRVFDGEGTLIYEEWYINGIMHREDGPAYIQYYENGNTEIEEWYLNGEMGRSNTKLPSRVLYYNNGVMQQEEWHQSGIKTREDGPAEIFYNENGKLQIEIWYVNGVKHCLSEPAYCNHDYNSEWYINGNEISWGMIEKTLGDAFVIPLTISNQLLLKLRFG